MDGYTWDLWNSFTRANSVFRIDPQSFCTNPDIT